MEKLKRKYFFLTLFSVSVISIYMIFLQDTLEQTDGYDYILTPEMDEVNKQTILDLSEKLNLNLNEPINEEVSKEHSKLTGILSAVSDKKTPSREELALFYENNKHRYEGDIIFDFLYLIFPSNSSKTDSYLQAEQKLKLINSEEEISPQHFSGNLDPYLPSNSSLVRKFGYGFASKLKALLDEGKLQKMPDWIGPITGRDGAYLLNISSITTSPAPDLDAIIEEVINDWRLDQIKN